jgi:hypothetical protein
MLAGMSARLTALNESLDGRVSERAPNPRSGSLAELLAVGGASIVLFPLSWLLRRSLGLDDAQYAVGLVMFHAAHFVNDPHFAVTYLLFYRDARRVLCDAAAPGGQRLRTLFAGVVVPVGLAAWALWAFASGSAARLGAMIQLMFLLVGWHYAKQGFGALTLLSARRGVRFVPLERRLILLHCYAAWAYAWLSPAHAAGQFEEKGVLYWAPAIPEWLETLGLAAFALSAFALGWVLHRKWRREARLPWLPLLTFVVTIWLWTVYTRLDPLVRYMIPALHSLQYLYFVGLLRRNEARVHEGPPTFGPPVRTQLGMLTVGALALGYVLFRGAPALFDGALVGALAAAPGARAFGPTPLFAALFVIVNLHHYFMDAVLWRSDNPATRYLREP